MNVIAIICLCSIGFCYGEAVRALPYTGVSGGAVRDFAARSMFRSGNAVYGQEVVSEEALVPNDLFERNERLVNVLQTFQKNLAFKSEDNNDRQKQKFTRVSFFLLHYFNANEGNFLLNFAKAFRKFLEVKHKPASVLAGPIWALLSKFVGAVATREAVVQEVCVEGAQNNCKDYVKKRDEAAIKNCYQYYQNVLLHKKALETIKSAENVLKFVLEVSNTEELPDVEPYLRERLSKFNYDIAEVKEVFRLLTYFSYHCSYNVDAINEVFVGA